VNESPQATADARKDGAQAEGTSPADDQAGSEPMTRRYPEWDYVIERERPSYCAVQELRRTPRVTVELPAGLERRVKAAAQRAHQASRPLRRCRDGLELDLASVVFDAALRARGAGGDGRLFIGRRRRRVRSSTLLLLDLSASLQKDQLHLLQSVTVALAASLPQGAELAIDGFCSRGREDVRYERFKPFEAPAPRLAPERSISGSTRLGAALRHATELLAARRATRKLLLVVSDGEPADVDIFDDRYLIEDARRACDGARQRSIQVVAWCLRRQLGPTPRRVFGAASAVCLERLGQLPCYLLNAYSLRRSGRSGDP
jgi:nitric oxide reductase activation protein